ncbi:MAG: right-handed parallel beta-helix repeat-containing protein [Pseudomonadota bacterium]|nr:right-handed parallel beta-helix repeat-containing protein [Pseudomonadota bacterium]
MTHHFRRRDALQSIGAATAALILPASGARAAGREFTPEMFGAVGDGRSDDHAAFVRLAAAVTQAGGGTVRFGRRKRYRLDQVHVGGPRRNNLPIIGFTRCSGLTVDFNESTVDVKGDFHRSADVREGRQSFLRSVDPLVFTDCSNLIVRNGVMNGNADRMTRDRTVVESSGRGIMLSGCTQVLLEDLHIHHFPTDGVSVGQNAERRVSRNVRLSRVRLTNNARLGLFIQGASGVTATDCVFSENGYTGGTYYHRPGAGVDLEPNWEMDLRSDLRALRCRFDNNRGSPLVAGNPDKEAFVELIDCSGTAPSHRRLILTAERSLIRGGSWHNVQISCAYLARRRFRSGISIEVTGGIWSGDDPGWNPVYDLNWHRPEVRIHSNRFELRSPQPYEANALFQCANVNHRFENNNIFVAAGGHGGAGDRLVGRFTGALVGGNQWSTDLRPPRRFVNNYSGARGVSGERFSGSFAGVSL